MAQINRPDQYFNTVLWTGNGTSQSITGVNFQPDLVWLKSRSIVESHGLFDIIRGAGERLVSNSTDAEATRTSVQSSFDSDGFSVGGSAQSNQSSATYCAWNWLADNTTGSSNTDGSITSTVSASTVSGFSIVSYTGTGANATVGHGLGSAPQVVIVKERSGADGWHVGHASLGFTKNLYLNLTNTPNTETAIFNDTAPTSSVFSLGNNTGINESGSTYITYCFAEKKGFSKFGSYTGNGSADGTFVYTGFKPAFVITKSSSTGGTYYNWGMWDTARSPSNVNNKILAANTSDDENNPSNLGANQNIDFLSNGFKHRSSDVVNNSSGVTYIYMAFAESPLVGTNNTPATAR